MINPIEVAYEILDMITTSDKIEKIIDRDHVDGTTYIITHPSNLYDLISQIENYVEIGLRKWLDEKYADRKHIVSVRLYKSTIMDIGYKVECKVEWIKKGI